MPEQDELLWDDGTAYPEYCLDQFPLVGKVRTGLSETSPGPTSESVCRMSMLSGANALRAAQHEALAWLAAGFGVLGLIGVAANYNDKASKVPFVSPLIHQQ